MSDEEQTEPTELYSGEFGLVGGHRPDEWIAALEAVHLISATVGGDIAAKSTLLSRMSDGAMPCRASMVLQEAEIGSVDWDDLNWGRRPKEHKGQRDKVYFKHCGDGESFELARDFLAASDSWAIDPDHISWPEGRIIATRPAIFPRGHLEKNSPSTRIRRAVEGLLFERSYLEEMAGKKPTKHHNPANGVMPASAKPNDIKYEMYAHEAAALVVREKLSPNAAFKKVISTTKMQDDLSVVRAIRQAYGLMYRKDGRPYQN